MNTIKSFEIKNYNYLIDSKVFDIIHNEFLFLDDKLTSSSILNITDKGINKTLLFNHKCDNEIDNKDFLFIEETNILFFAKLAYENWAAFDLNTSETIRKESAVCIDGIERIKNRVIIYEEIISECTDLYANRVNTALCDPPSEMTKFKDRIEFVTCNGLQILDFKL